MAEKKKLGFAENFMLSGVAAAVSKTAAAPIERVKLLVQNQTEMIKQGRLDKPYTGVVDCTVRTFRNEGVLPFWRGNAHLSKLRLYSSFNSLDVKSQYLKSKESYHHNLNISEYCSGP
jgi:hypothetical protein